MILRPFKIDDAPIILSWIKDLSALNLAIQKAKNVFGAKKITLGVFDNNPSALHCYESVGFQVIGTDSYFIDGEEWTEKEMEINCIQ